MTAEASGWPRGSRAAASLVLRQVHELRGGMASLVMLEVLPLLVSQKVRRNCEKKKTDRLLAGATFKHGQARGHSKHKKELDCRQQNLPPIASMPPPPHVPHRKNMQQNGILVPKTPASGNSRQQMNGNFVKANDKTTASGVAWKLLFYEHPGLTLLEQPSRSRKRCYAPLHGRGL